MRRGYFLKYREFREMNHGWRKYRKKQPNHWILILFYYPFVCLAIYFFTYFMRDRLEKMKNRRYPF